MWTVLDCLKATEVLNDKGAASVCYDITSKGGPQANVRASDIETMCAHLRQFPSGTPVTKFVVTLMDGPNKGADISIVPPDADVKALMARRKDVFDAITAHDGPGDQT